jgi:hypothetical protein
MYSLELWIEGEGFIVKGFGIEFRVWGFQVQGSGLRV